MATPICLPGLTERQPRRPLISRPAYCLSVGSRSSVCGVVSDLDACSRSHLEHEAASAAVKGRPELRRGLLLFMFSLLTVRLEMLAYQAGPICGSGAAVHVAF